MLLVGSLTGKYGSTCAEIVKPKAKINRMGPKSIGVECHSAIGSVVPDSLPTDDPQRLQAAELWVELYPSPPD